MVHKVTFDSSFMSGLENISGFDDNARANLQRDLERHLDCEMQGSGMPIWYLGKTDSFHFPQAVKDAHLFKIHIYDTDNPNFNKQQQQSWNKAKRLRDRTSDTYFVYTKDYFDEYSCHFLGVVSPAHIKCNVQQSGMRYFGSFVDAANKFNGLSKA